MSGSSIWAPVGDKGPTGDQGPPGPQGPQGPQGLPGPDAAAFSQFVSDLKNAVDTTKGVTLIGGSIRVVDTVAALQALPKTGSPIAKTLGYSNKQDRGGATYYLDPTDTTSPNGPFVVVATDGGRWKLGGGYPSFSQQGTNPALSNDAGVLLGYNGSGVNQQGNGNKYNYYHFRITNDNTAQVSGTNGATGSKVDGLNVTMNFGGPLAQGGRHAGDFVLLQGYGGGGATSSTNADRFYVGMQGQCLTDSGDGGSASAGYLANYFGMSSYTGIYANAYYVNNVTGGEFNTDITVGVGANAGKRVRIHTGIQIASIIGERGSDLDAAVSISNLSGNVGWGNGIAFHGLNGAPALAATSTAFKIYPSGAVSAAIDRVIDVRGVGFNFFLQSDTVALNASGLNITAANSFLALGLATTSNTPTIQLRSGGASSAFDTRLVSVGGNATAGNGTLQIDAGAIVLGGVSNRAQADNYATSGTSAVRWSVVYSAGGVQTTSDERAKMDIQDINDLILDAWEAVEFKQFKMIEDFEKIGDKAKFQFGIIAQKVVSSFKAKGLDALKYGIVELGKWEATPAVLDDEGKELQPARAAGERYSVNYSQAICLEAAVMRREVEQLKAAVAKLAA